MRLVILQIILLVIKISLDADLFLNFCISLFFNRALSLFKFALDTSPHPKRFESE